MKKKNLGKVTIHGPDGQSIEGEAQIIYRADPKDFTDPLGEVVESIQYPLHYKFDFEPLAKLSWETLNELQRRACKESEALLMIRIFGLGYYTLRYDAFDTLTRLGYKLNLVTGQYYKP